MANLNLPFGRIKGADVEALGGTASAYGAINISSKLVEAVSGAFKSFGGLPPVIGNVVDALDGTCAFKFNTPGEADGRLSLRRDADVSGLMSFLSTWGQPSRQGDVLLLKANQSMTGEITAKMASRILDGAYMGIVVSPDFLQYDGKPIKGMEGMSAISVLLEPKDRSVELKATFTGKDPKKNFILQMR